MRITLERSQLLKSLGHVHRVVERRNTIPILSNVLMSARENELMLKATDLDLEITERTNATVEQTGATTVPAHILFDIVRKLPDGAEVMLATGAQDHTMSVSAGRANFTLQTLPDSDFPDLTAGTFSHRFELEAEQFKRLIDRTNFAISTEETRYYLNGIYLHTVEDGETPLLRAVATDGHRLAQAQVASPASCAGMPGIIIPRKTIAELQKLLDGQEGLIEVELSDAKIRFNIDQVVLTSKLIDGTFPDYQRVIPAGNDRKLVLDKSTFSSAVDRVATISAERGRAVKLGIGAERVQLDVNNPDHGSASEEVAAEFAGDPLEIGFNAKYLGDITSQLVSDEVVFMLNDSGSPSLVLDTADEDVLYVLMPMRV